VVTHECLRVSNQLIKLDNYDSPEYQELHDYEARLGRLEADSIVLRPFCNKIGKDMIFLMPEKYWICMDCNQKINKKI
jgi:hypothetical protein